LIEPEEFEDIVVRTNEQGGLVRVKDIARVELGAKDYFTDVTLDNKPAIGVAVYRATEANALQTMEGVRAELERQKTFMPEDMDYLVVYDTTDYVVETINEIILHSFHIPFGCFGNFYIFTRLASYTNSNCCNPRINYRNICCSFSNGLFCKYYHTVCFNTFYRSCCG